MGVAEHRQPVGRERRRRLGRGGRAFRRLAGQAVHQVKIDRPDPGRAQPFDHALDLVEGLDAVDAGLHLGVEGLDAQADAGDAGLARRRDEGVGQQAGIQFGGDLGAGAQAQARAQTPDQGGEMGR